MTRKNARFLIVGNLLVMSFATSLFAMNAERSGEVNAVRESIPLNLPQNNFSIDSANNLSSDELGTLPNSDLKIAQSEDTISLSTSDSFQKAGRSEGKPKKMTPPPYLRFFRKEGKKARALEKKNSSFARVSKTLKLDAQALRTQNKTSFQFKLDNLFDGSASQTGILSIPSMPMRPMLIRRLEGLLSPFGIAIDREGRVYVTDDILNRVKIFDRNFHLIHVLTGFWSPEAIAVDQEGRIYVADTNNFVIKIFNRNFQLIRKLRGLNYPNYPFGIKPHGITVDLDGFIYAADGDKHRVKIFDRDLRLIHQLKGVGYPVGIAVDQERRIYVVDIKNNQVAIFDRDLNLIHTLEGFEYPRAIALDQKGRIYITDKNIVRIFNRRFNLIRALDGFQSPSGIALDQEGRIYIADTGNNRLQIFPSLDEIEAADKKRQDDAKKFLSQKTENSAVPAPANKEPSARDRFKIIWDDASRLIP